MVTQNTTNTPEVASRVLTGSEEFPHIFSPFQLRNVTLRNRIQVTSHGTYNVDANGAPDAREAAYWAARAKGGAALCIMGTHLVHPSSPFNIGQFKNWGDFAIPGLEGVAQAIHAHGGIAVAQMGHMGQRVLEAQACWAPSAIAWQAKPFGVIPHAMTKSEIREMIAAYGSACARTVKAGFDGVELAVGHGQLINAFLSPLTNQRDDEYGGSAENRLRFCLQIIDTIRQEIGDAPVLGFRINATDRTPTGLAEAEWLEIAARLDGLGSGDYFNVSIDFTGSIIPTCLHSSGTFMPWARTIKQHVNLPVFSTGRVTDPEQAEAILARGDVDVVGMTRAHIADPDLLQKLATGRRADIRPCIGCLQMCVGELWHARNVKCVYNPITGFEMNRSATFEPALRAQRVSIIGGGAAGLEAARVAASRGHHVTLYEASDQFGGAFRRYAAGAGRGDFARAPAWLEAQARKAGAVMHLNTSATAQMIRAAQPDVVMIATGGAPAPLPFDAVDLKFLLDIQHKVEGTLLLQDNDYGAAVSAAVTLSERGADVVVIAGPKGFGPKMEFNMRDDLMAQAIAQGVRFWPGTTITARPLPGIVHLTNSDGIQTALNITHLAYCEALPADPAWVDGLRAALPLAQVYVIGDAAQPARLEHAIAAAYQAAMAIGTPSTLH